MLTDDFFSFYLFFFLFSLILVSIDTRALINRAPLDNPFRFPSLCLSAVGRPWRELLVIPAFQSNFPSPSLSFHRYKMYNE